MLNLLDHNALSTERAGKPEIKWLLLVVLCVLAVFFGIKISIYTFLHNAPEGFFKVSSAQVKPSGPPDSVLSPDTVLESSYQWQALPTIAPAPLDNPLTAEKISLGKMLFFDKNLSADRTLSCASCHDLFKQAGADGSEVSIGIMGQKGNRNAPTVWNAAFQRVFFWDGRSGSLEHQAIQPFLNPVEMGMASTSDIETRVREQSRYQAAFMAAFNGDSEITIDKIAKAIASFERTLVTYDSPYDDFVRGNQTALTQQQLNGMALFEKAGCVHCHFGPNFSAASVFNDGLAFRVFPANPEQLDTQFSFLAAEGNTAVWRVPSLRNVALTGPWLHNGQVDNLHDVVRIMATAQLGKSELRAFQWSENSLDIVENPDLTEQQIDDIVSFLHSLSSRQLSAAKE